MQGRSAIQNGSKVGVAALAAATLLVVLEGYVGKPYKDVADVITDCFGNTKQVSMGKIRTLEECKALLNDESYRIAEFIDKDLPDITPNQLAAITSFTYNVGDGAYRGSTLRKKFKAGEYTQGCYEMQKWVYITKAGEKVLSPGLKKRRDKEVALCLKP